MAAPHLTLSERFVAQCNVAISSNYDTCGTVTRAEMDHLAVGDLEALFKTAGKFHDMDAWFVHTIEMKACGVRIYALYDWIMANADRTQFKAAVTGIKAVKGPSLLQPFVFGRQDSVINRDYWRTYMASAHTGGTITTYATAPAALATATHTVLANNLGTVNPTGITKENGTAYALTDVMVIRIQSTHSIPHNNLHFRPRDIVHIFSRAAGGAFEHGTWKVLSSVSGVATDTQPFIDLATVSANLTGDTYDATPAAGIVIPGINNVSDFEEWCQNMATIDPRKRVPFWLQTFRAARCIDSEYRAVFMRLMESNRAFREFGDLDLAERNRQDELEMKKRFVNAFFFNKAVSDNQTLALWESLEAINAVESGSSGVGVNSGVTKLMARRANFIGVREQLNTCGRVFDIGGATTPFQFYEFLELNYQIMRARKSQGRNVTDLDWYCSSSFAVIFSRLFSAYCVCEYGTGQFRMTEPVRGVNQLGQPWESYRFKRPSGVNINIVTDEFFDDWKSEFSGISGHETIGNLFVCLDIGKPGQNGGTIYWAQTAANRKVYKSAEIDQLARIDSTYRCVMETVSQEQNLMSHSGTAVVECPLNSAWIENFDDTVTEMGCGTAGGWFEDLTFDGTLDLLT